MVEPAPFRLWCRQGGARCINSANTHFAYPLTLQPRRDEYYESAVDASMRELHVEAAQHLLHAARQRLRGCEKAFTEHLGEEDTSLWVEHIASAEREVSEARALVKILSAG